MKQTIKQDIMDAGKRLFSEKGFNDTSMRDIAAVLNISVGNLTYHYKKKEDLIEAILLQDHQHYKKPEPLRSLKDLNTLLQKSMAQRANRPYYYRYYDQLAQTCPAVYKMQVSVLNDLSDVLTKSFHDFVSVGLLKKEFLQEYDKIIGVIMTVMVHGLPDFYQAQKSVEDGSTLKCIWSVIISCLTEKGRQEYQLLLEQDTERNNITPDSII